MRDRACIPVAPKLLTITFELKSNMQTVIDTVSIARIMANFSQVSGCSD